MAAPLAAAPDARPSDIEREISAAWKAHKGAARPPVSAAQGALHIAAQCGSPARPRPRALT